MRGSDMSIIQIYATPVNFFLQADNYILSIYTFHIYSEVQVKVIYLLRKNHDGKFKGVGSEYECITNEKEHAIDFILFVT